MSGKHRTVNQDWCDPINNSSEVSIYWHQFKITVNSTGLWSKSLLEMYWKSHLLIRGSIFKKY